MVLALIFLGLSGAAPVYKTLKLPHDGKIRIYIYHLSEAADIQYLDEKGYWIESAYQKINKMLRSRGDLETTTMDRRLIELADHLQDHFKVDTIEVISGFRSPKFNKSLKEQGRGVASNSFHTKGMAMDIHIDELKESTIRDYLLSKKLGGVGYYGNILMVHMDFGPVRSWHSGDYKDNTEIGIFNKKNTMKFRTDKLFYEDDSRLQFTSSGVKPGKLILEKFYRGKFKRVGVVGAIKKEGLQTWSVKDLQSKIIGMPKHGKLRFRIESSGDWQNSNEFYFKRQ